MPLAHGRDERAHDGAHVWIEEEIAKDVPTGIVVHERELIGRAVQIREGYLLQEVAVPETVGMMPFVKTPHRQWGVRMEGVMDAPFEPFDARGTDRDMLTVLQIPRDALRT